MTAPRTGGAGRGAFRLTGNVKKDSRAIARQGAFRLNERQGQGDDITKLLLETLQQGDLGAGEFLDFFGNAARAANEPVQRDFERTRATGTANVARRFGGNASTEELRIGGQVDEIFGDILARNLALIGPQAVQAAQARASLLAGTQANFANQQADLQQLLLQAIQQGKGSNIFGKIAGGVIGGAAGAFGGPFLGAAGAKAGSNVFGGR